MKIATWAPQNGDENERIENRICHLPVDDLDLIVITGSMDKAVSQPFYQKGLKHLVHSKTGQQEHEIIIASRRPLVYPKDGQGFAQEKIGIKVYWPEKLITILGIDFPDDTDIQAQAVFFQKLIHYLKAQTATRTILIGNFKIRAMNLNTILDFKHYFQEIALLGWSDAWRTLHPVTYEQVWFGNAKKEVQLNLVVLSPVLRQSLLDAYHCQVIPNIKCSQSDSRILIVELQ